MIDEGLASAHDGREARASPQEKSQYQRAASGDSSATKASAIRLLDFLNAFSFVEATVRSPARLQLLFSVRLMFLSVVGSSVRRTVVTVMSQIILEYANNSLTPSIHGYR